MALGVLAHAMQPADATPSPWKPHARLGLRFGLLVGVFEAIAVARWDVVMHDPTYLRVLMGIGWGAVIACLAGVSWSGIAVVARGQLRWAAPVVVAGIIGARWLVGDRFEVHTWWLVPLVFALTWHPRTHGLAAVLVAVASLWGRVPNYTLSLTETLVFWGPAAAAVIVLSVVGMRWLPVIPALALAAPLFSPEVVPTQDRPNILYILVDTLRVDHVAPYGDEVDTDIVRRLSDEGVLFADAITVIPKTTQSVAAQQTGRYPINNGVRVLKDGVPDTESTLAEVLREQGYATAAFVHNGWVMRGRGFEQGFEQFWSWFELERPYGTLRYTGVVTLLDGLTLRRVGKFDGNTSAEVVVDRALAWMEDTQRPFYAYVHTFDPHWPYRPPGQDGECLVNNIRDSKISRGRMIFKNELPEEENARARELYRHEVEHNLDELERLLDALEQQGRLDDTIVVFTADHGHSMGEHDYYYHHGELLYDASLSIPLAMRYPAGIAPGTVVDHQVRSIDIMPTVLGLAGIDAGDDMDGTDVFEERPGFALLETDKSYFKSNKRRYIKGNKGKPRGIRDGMFKLIYTPKKQTPLFELYDLKADPGEPVDLVQTEGADPAVLLRMIKALGEALPPREVAYFNEIGTHFDRLPASMPEPTEDDAGGIEEEVDEADLEMLRSLGYVQ